MCINYLFIQKPVDQDSGLLLDSDQEVIDSDAVSETFEDTLLIGLEPTLASTPVVKKITNKNAKNEKVG